MTAAETASWDLANKENIIGLGKSKKNRPNSYCEYLLSVLFVIFVYKYGRIKLRIERSRGN